MNWKYKALAQGVFSRIPGGASLNYLAQRFVTRVHDQLPRSVADRLGKAQWFLEAFQEHSSVPPAEAHFYEFGVGWHLAGPLSLYGLGVGRQTVIDIVDGLRMPLVNRVIEVLRSRPEEGLRGYAHSVLTRDDLQRFYGIEYLAPLDGRQSGLPAASVDCITSTFTMEHIPKEDLRSILRECARLLKPGGVICSLIDYQDHYAYNDPAISVYNFLQFSERDWQPFNNSLHYQNRMRHRQYVELFKEAGFALVREELNGGSKADRDVLCAMQVAEPFQGFALEELVIRSSKMVAVKPVADPPAQDRIEIGAGSVPRTR
jgi:SAM-dependent methyltransferase